MHVESVNIKNFKGIESLEIELKGRNCFVMGPNGAGKTSFLDAIWCAVTGKGWPEEPVTKGKSKGLIEVDLGEHIARLKFSKGKDPVFELEAKEADDKTKLVKSPRTVLNEKLKVINFDVNEFLGKTGAEQVKYLCKVIGLDFTEINGQLEEALEIRKLDTKKLQALKATADFYDKALADKDLIDVVALSGQIADAAKKWETYNKGKLALTVKQERIDEVKRQIEALNNELVTCENSKEQIEVWLRADANKPLEDSDYNAMKLQLQTANQVNAGIEEAKNLRKIELEVQGLETTVEASNNAVDDLRREKAKSLKAALNVESLEYDVENEHFTWKGLPFDKNQINTADQIIAGLKIGATLLGELRILKFDGSLIDKKNFALIKEFAERENIELFVEIVDRENEVLQIITQ